MKKLFAILAIAGALTACNGSDGDKTATTDSTKTETPVMDASKIDSTAKKMMDSTVNKMVDTAKKVMDKAVDKMKDATKKN